MNISAPFIRRPIATALLMLGLLVGGLVAYPLMPVASLPNVNYPTLTITAQLPGADPQTMASSVASPLELPATMQLRSRTSPPTTSTPPPWSAELRLMLRLVSTAVPVGWFRIAPPAARAALSSSV